MEFYERQVCNYDIRWAIANGWAVPPLCKLAGVQSMELAGIHLSGGDFVQKELQREMNKEATKHRICLITVEEMEGPTVLFTAGVDAAKACAHYLTHNYGVPAVYVHGKQDDEERKEALAAFKSGQAKVLCNCMVVAIGFDFPPTQTLIMGRPTKSLGFALQCWGRAFRPLPGTVDFPGSTVESRKQRIAAGKKPHAKIVDCTPSSQDHTLVTGIDMFVTDDEVKEYVRKAAEKKPLTPEEIAALAEAQAAKIAAAKAIEEMRKNTQGRATGSVIGREIELRGGKRCVGTYFNPIKGKYAGQKLNQLPDHYVAWAAEQIRTGWIRSMFRREQERRNAERFSHR